MNDDIIARTPQADCPACQEQRLHTKEERTAHHPMSGHGFYAGQGWSHPTLEPKPKEQPDVA